MTIKTREGDITENWLRNLFSNQEMGEVANFYGSADYQGWTVKKEYGFLVNTRINGFVPRVTDTLDETVECVLELESDRAMFEQHRSHI